MNQQPPRRLWLAVLLAAASGCGPSDPRPGAVPAAEAARATPAGALEPPTDPGVAPEIGVGSEPAQAGVALSEAEWLETLRRADLIVMVQSQRAWVLYLKDALATAEADESAYLSRVRREPPQPGSVGRDLAILHRDRARVARVVEEAESRLARLESLLEAWEARHPPPGSAATETGSDPP